MKIQKYCDDLIPSPNTVIMCSEPVKAYSAEEMRRFAIDADDEADIAVLFAMASNEAWWVEDCIYDYEEGTPEHRQACQISDAWFAVSDILENKIFNILKREGITIPEK